MESDIIIELNPEASDSLVTKLVKIPQPAGIVAPLNENPSTVVPPEETVKPANSASPPDTLATIDPSTSNWNPAIAISELYKISLSIM